MAKRKLTFGSFAEEGKWTSGADSTLLVDRWQAWVDGEGHWKVRGPDPDDEAHYADGDIELTEAEYTEAGNSAARRKIRVTRAKKAARSYINSMLQSAGGRRHAPKKTAAQLDREIAAALTPSATSPIPSDSENARLDDLTAYTSTLLAHISGADLDALLTGLVKRHGRSDAQFRSWAIDNVHPDDLATALATRGYSLARVGIASIARR